MALSLADMRYDRQLEHKVNQYAQYEIWADKRGQEWLVKSESRNSEFKRYRKTMWLARQLKVLVPKAFRSPVKYARKPANFSDSLFVQRFLTGSVELGTFIKGNPAPTPKFVRQALRVLVLEWFAGVGDRHDWNYMVWNGEPVSIDHQSAWGYYRGVSLGEKSTYSTLNGYIKPTVLQAVKPIDVMRIITLVEALPVDTFKRRTDDESARIKSGIRKELSELFVEFIRSYERELGKGRLARRRGRGRPRCTPKAWKEWRDRGARF